MNIKKSLLLALSFIIVAFGQPAAIPLCGIMAICFGYALFFGQICTLTARNRFLTGTLFFTCVQLVQLFWLISHPFLYIYAVYPILSLVLGIQFGLICLLASEQKLKSLPSLILIPALWVLCEWTRLFYFSGYSLNPIGLAVASTQSTLQLASIGGVFGLGFWILLSNSLFVRAWLIRKRSSFILAICTLLLPALFGLLSLNYREEQQQEHDLTHKPLKALIIESATLPEELDQNPQKPREPILDALHSWEAIFTALAPYRGSSFDLILFPEIVVCLPAEAPIFHLKQAEAFFQNLVPSQQQNVSLVPVAFTNADEPLVSSATISQALAKLFQGVVVCGLEGIEYRPQNLRNTYFNSAFFFHPTAKIQRYDKEILLPGGEYIPFEWVKPLAASYGLFDSFGRGHGVEISTLGEHKIGASICYEDTFGNFVRQNKLAGATVLTNLTNDGWYPNSDLGIQHCEHARLRAVENGLPLIRSCNFGVSGAIDSLGKTVALHSLEEGVSASAFAVDVSTYTYSTIYSQWGDAPIVIFSIMILVGGSLASISKRLTGRGCAVRSREEQQ